MDPLHQPPILAAQPAAGLMACVGYRPPNAAARAALTRVMDALDSVGIGNMTIHYSPYSDRVAVQDLTPAQLDPLLLALGLTHRDMKPGKFHRASEENPTAWRAFAGGGVELYVHYAEQQVPA